MVAARAINSTTFRNLLTRVLSFQLPQFDNMYLDMNGIIHVCSHPDDSNVHFRMSEEQMFRDILHYIDTIFHMIKPRKLFFMAVDGVAPRAKMNQQRSRRFVIFIRITFRLQKSKISNHIFWLVWMCFGTDFSQQERPWN